MSPPEHQVEDRRGGDDEVQPFLGLVLHRVRSVPLRQDLIGENDPDATEEKVNERNDQFLLEKDGLATSLGGWAGHTHNSFCPFPRPFTSQDTRRIALCGAALLD